MLPISINNTRDVQRTDAKVGSERVVKVGATGLSGVVAPSQDECVDLKCAKSTVSAGPELMGLSRNKARSAYLNYGKETAEELMRKEIFAMMDESKKRFSALGRKELTPAEQEQVADLKKKELEVMAKVNARMSAGCDLCEAPRYKYEMGPDGKKYKTAVEIKIDVSPCKTPEETIEKMHRVMKAALSGTEVSDSDRAIYKEAQRMAQLAQNQLIQERAMQTKEEQRKRAREIEQRNGDPDKTRLSGKILRTLEELPADAFKFEMPKPNTPVLKPIIGGPAANNSAPSGGNAETTAPADAPAPTA